MYRSILRRMPGMDLCFDLYRPSRINNRNKRLRMRGMVFLTQLHLSRQDVCKISALYFFAEA